MNLAHYLGLLHRGEDELDKALVEVGEAHLDEPEVHEICVQLAAQCHRHVERLAQFVERYGEEADDEPERLHSENFKGTQSGSLGLLRDLHDLYLMASESDITWTLVGQAAQGVRDTDLLDVVTSCEGETAIQLKWLKIRMKQAAPQALVVASD